MEDGNHGERRVPQDCAKEVPPDDQSLLLLGGGDAAFLSLDPSRQPERPHLWMPSRA